MTLLWPSSTPTDRTSRRLLLVEDDRATLKALRTLLTRQGWDVASASTVAEATRLLELEPVCLVLDLMLPDGEGTSLLRAVRESNRELRVVVTTGTVDPVRLAEVAQLHPDALLYKPINLHDLLEKLGPVP